jgi:tetratricopeptide (TPR) repeat protein
VKWPRLLLLFSYCLFLASRLYAAGALPEFDRLWDWDHPAQTEQRFRALLPEARTSGDHAYLAQLLSQVARAQGIQGHRKEAHATLDEAERLLTDRTKTARVRCLLERGRLFNDDKKPDEARSRFTQAWELARAAGDDSNAIDAAHMLGIIETGKKALEWDQKALAVAEQSKDARCKGWLGPLYNNIGWTYYQQKDYPHALELLRKAQEVYERGKSPGTIRVARYSVGKALRALGRVDEALAIQQGVQVEMEKVNEPDGYVYEELGECLLAQGKRDEARPFFKKAYDLLSKDPDLADEPKRLQRLKELGTG